MPFETPAGPKKIQTDMTPMIDVVFQLLVFFLFTFKIAPVEGEIGVNMPAITAGSAESKDDVTVEKVPIKLVAGAAANWRTCGWGTDRWERGSRHCELSRRRCARRTRGRQAEWRMFKWRSMRIGLCGTSG